MLVGELARIDARGVRCAPRAAARRRNRSSARSRTRRCPRPVRVSMRLALARRPLAMAACPPGMAATRAVVFAIADQQAGGHPVAGEDRACGWLGRSGRIAASAASMVSPSTRRLGPTGWAAARAMARFSSATPCARCPTVSTTGKPSSFSISAMSIRCPAARASSDMFRHRTGLAPVCMICASRTRLRSSCVESATTTTTSGASRQLVLRHALVGREGAEAVGAGQIDDVRRRAARCRSGRCGARP